MEERDPDLVVDDDISISGDRGEHWKDFVENNNEDNSNFHSLE